MVQHEPVNVYPWVVFVHVAALVLFFLAHGVSLGVALRLRHERDERRVRALLELSSWSMGRVTGLVLLVAFVTGILAGFLGNWWGRGWIWLSLVLFLVVATLMYPLAAKPLHAIRAAAGVGAAPPFGFGDRKPHDVGPADPAELGRLLDRYDPRPMVALSVGAVLVIAWLMLVKPL